MVSLTLLAFLATSQLALANPSTTNPKTQLPPTPILTTILVPPPSAEPTTLRRLTPCATIRCAAGYTCVAYGSRGKCVANSLSGSRICGATICASGTTCCNASCGVCTPPGMMCTQQICERRDDGPVIPPVEVTAVVPKPKTSVVPKPKETGTGTGEPKGPKCGSGRCEVGNVCCNDSCGICTPPNGACIMLWCGKSDPIR